VHGNGKSCDMAYVRAASVAASNEWVGEDGVRRPGGEVHAWLPGTNQTVCGLALSRSRLRRFPHVPFDFRTTDVLTPSDEVRYLCTRCLAATTRRDERSWTRTAPRP
jgi:hypothetical protein